MIEKYTCGSFGTNTYVVSDEKGNAVVIDPGMIFGHNSVLIKGKYHVVAVLITHGHLDHIDGIQHFHDIPVYIHKEDVEALSDPHLSCYDTLGNGMIPFNVYDYDVRKLKGGEVLNLLSGMPIKVLSTPGHTKGSVCYNIGDTVFTGDTLFKMSCGRTDYPGGDEKALKKSLKKIFTEYPGWYNVYPGHREYTTIAEEQAACPYKL